MIGLALSTLSCTDTSTSHDPVNESSREQTLLQTIRFKPIQKEDIELRSASNSGASLGIVNITLGRKSQNCFGFGICEVDWFPGWNEWAEDALSRSNKSRENTVSGLLLLDSNGKPYIQLELAAEITGFTKDELSLPIDELINIPSSGSEAFKPGFAVNPGSYDFSNRIGDFGGYKIPVRLL